MKYYFDFKNEQVIVRFEYIKNVYARASFNVEQAYEFSEKLRNFTAENDASRILRIVPNHPHKDIGAKNEN